MRRKLLEEALEGLDRVQFVHDGEQQWVKLVRREQDVWFYVPLGGDESDPFEFEENEFSAELLASGSKRGGVPKADPAVLGLMGFLARSKSWQRKFRRSDLASAGFAVWLESLEPERVFGQTLAQLRSLRSARSGELQAVHQARIELLSTFSPIFAEDPRLESRRDWWRELARREYTELAETLPASELTAGEWSEQGKDRFAILYDLTDAASQAEFVTDPSRCEEILGREEYPASPEPLRKNTPTGIVLSGQTGLVHSLRLDSHAHVRLRFRVQIKSDANLGFFAPGLFEPKTGNGVMAIGRDVLQLVPGAGGIRPWALHDPPGLLHSGVLYELELTSSGARFKLEGSSSGALELDAFEHDVADFPWTELGPTFFALGVHSIHEWHIVELELAGTGRTQARRSLWNTYANTQADALTQPKLDR